MKKFVLGTLILAFLVFIVWPDHDKKNEVDENFGVMKDPISDIGYADTTDLTFNLNNLDGLTNENAIDTVLQFYGLELDVPESWIVDDATGEMKDMDSKVEITFSNVTDEEYESYVDDFYSKHHLGDKELSKFKTSNGYKWVVQIEGVSIKDTYTFKKENEKMILIIEKNF